MYTDEVDKISKEYMERELVGKDPEGKSAFHCSEK
jgi:hypothetical protein